MDYFDILLAKKLSGGGGGEITVEGLSVEENGTYTAPSGKAYSPVVVNLPLGEKAITANGEYNASADDLKGFSKVTVNVAGFSKKAMPTGAISSFNDGTANPLTKLKIAINPVQAGSGDPSPSNPRPISGWTGANVSVKGKNLIKVSADNEVRVNGNPTRTYEDNGCTINVSVVGAYYVVWNILKITPDMVGTSFTWSASSAPSGTVRFVYAFDWSDSIFDLTATTITVTNTLVGKYLGLRFYNSLGSSQSIKNVMVEVASEASTFEAYSANSAVVPVSWQTEAGTVYAGTLDVTNGTLKARPYYASYNGEALIGPWISSLDEYEEGTTPTTGAQVVDLGGTETTCQLTPAQVSSILGTNNIWSDTGDILEGEYFVAL